MARRSVWDDEEKDQEKTANNGGWGSLNGVVPGTTDNDIESPPPPQTPLDMMRKAKPKKKRVRDRSWDKAHPRKTYRKVPNEIRDAVKGIAEAWGYTTSQVAQAFLEYALMCYRRGDFTLELELDPRYGLTLMPGGWGAEKKLTWAENLTPKKAQSKRKKRRRKKESNLWKQRVSYQITPKLATEIDRVCETRRNQDGSIARRTYHGGEVVARFLAHAIEAYNSGKLALQDPENA